MSVLHSAVLCFVLALPVVAQSQAFEKITIKPAHSELGSWHIEVLPNGDLITQNVSPIALLTYGYDLPINPSLRLQSVPGWAADRYDIAAKAPANGSPAISPDKAQNLAKQRIRQLLADRFKLVMHVDQKSMPVYALNVSGGGAKLQRSAAAEKDCVFNNAPNGCHSFVIGFGHPLNGNAVSLDDLARYIENWTDLPVVDRTRLSGLYTMHSEGWRPMRLPPPPPNGNGNVDFSSLPDIFTVLGKLGLELHREEAVLPVYTIQRMERPALN